VIQAEATRRSRMNLTPFVGIRGFAYSLSDFSCSARHGLGKKNG
jgi:hypothetical protein